ncbi:pirin-like protein (plasmid) [Cupriavidus necator N-1]|uniref:Pirin-like protein n=1 Tax=Cupriavidus necator (strain ATCC 43291 / DSM 13513 / CCUG 52238 / LMG 8453 / N-1) TaxID=1042878 RepID=F8GVS0_CUPNN|nr:pirin family protein [Cupriavidus necator]AEI82690.1 pirin-like protein [Cupriavidus necator N-1]MDX6007684.1 pirin family protein [Cupriavidus necator]
MTTTARMQRANRGSHFRAYRLHGADPALLDPFMGIDHAWMSAPTFPPHPHAGFSAVTYLFLDSETGIANRDSLGNSVLIEPGGLHWTAAGRGVIHEENPAVLGSTTHLLQIFVNLPRERQDAAPFALTLAPQDVPVVQRPGVRIRIPLGSFGDVRSPLVPPTDVTLLDISLDAGAALDVPLPAGQQAFVMPIFGSAELDGETFGLDDLGVPILPAGAEATTFKLTGKPGGAKVAVFIGRPLHQPVLSNGPMAFASQDSLSAATAAYHRGDLGSL